jgi:hypothetical protein
MIPFNYGLKQCRAQVVEELMCGKTLLPAPGQLCLELAIEGSTTSALTSGRPGSTLNGNVSSARC